MPYRSILVRAGLAMGVAVLSLQAPSARAETMSAAASQQRSSAAELAAGACRLGRWSTVIDRMRVVARGQRRAADWLCLARAQFHMGQWVAALDSYDELADSEVSAPSSAPASAAAKPAAKGRASRPNSTLSESTLSESELRQVGAVERQELERRLGWIEIVPSGPLPASLSLSLDGEVISPARVGVAFPVQPGVHAFSVQIGGVVLETDQWRIAQGEHRAVKLTLPAQPQPEWAVTPRDFAERQPKQNQTVPRFHEEPSGLERWAKRTLIVGGVVSGGGLLSMAASGGSREALYAGFGGLALGGASLMTGAALYLADQLRGSSPHDAAAPPAPQLQVQPWILSNGAGTGVSGSF